MVSYPRPLPDEPLPLDLLNTELVVDGQPVDVLASRAGFAEWLELHGFATRPGPTALAHLVGARAAIRGFLEDQDGSARRLDAVLEHARIRMRIGDDAPVGEIEVDEPSWLPGATTAIRLLDLLDQRDRIRRCAHPKCVLWFLDTSRNGTRRWHSMETCGNRTKAQRHATRQRRDDSVVG